MVTGVPEMTSWRADRWPVLARHGRAAEWLQVWADLGRAPGTVEAYARGLAEYLQVCERDGIDPLTANRAQVAVFVRELASRPGRRGGNVVSIDSGAGLANATMLQRLSVTWNQAGETRSVI
jgi:integrase/recombinase XerD